MKIRIFAILLMLTIVTVAMATPQTFLDTEWDVTGWDMPEDDLLWITNKGEHFLIVVPSLGIQERHNTPDAAVDSVFGSTKNVDEKIDSLRTTIAELELEIAMLETSKEIYKVIAPAEPIIRKILPYMKTGHPRLPQLGPAKEIAVTAIRGKLFPVTGWWTAHPGYDNDDYVKLIGFID